MKPLSLAFSPCPNDTFVFHALVHGLVPGAPPIEVTYADVDVTNTAAQDGRFDVVKVSYAALPWLLVEYALVPCGGALGRGCGPLVLTRSASPGVALPGANRTFRSPVASTDTRGTHNPDSSQRDAGQEALAGATVAVPGDRTTAYLLFRLWSADFPPSDVRVMPFAEIMPAVAAGTVDAGLVIHEARFTYPQYGLHAVADLGEWWEGEVGLPIPLGAILARRTLPLEQITGLVRASVRAAWADPAASRAYVMEHAQEMDRAVADAHIALYVNEFTDDLGDDGYAAAEALLTRAAAEGLVPPLPRPLR